MNSHPPRTPWNGFPDVLIHASQAGRRYVMVDDFVGMGGTLANLKGYFSCILIPSKAGAQGINSPSATWRRLQAEQSSSHD